MGQRRKKGKLRRVTAALLCGLMLISMLSGFSLPFFGKEKKEKPPERDAMDYAIVRGGGTFTEDVSGLLGLEEAPRKRGIFQHPSEVRGAVLRPGRDYLAKGSSAETIQTEIAGAISDAVGMNINTLYLETVIPAGAAYRSPTLPVLAAGCDPIAEAIAAAKEKNLFVYCIFNLQNYEKDGKIETSGVINTETVNRMKQELSAFLSTYSPDGLVFTGYYHPEDGESYARYLREGGGIGYETWLKESSGMLLREAIELVEKNQPGFAVGLLTDPVWANASDNAEGSRTKAGFQMLLDGNADVRSYVLDGRADFLLVDAYGSTQDSEVPFGRVAGWWQSLGAEAGIPVYLMQATQRTGSGAAGWKSEDELAKQIIAAQDAGGYCGTVFGDFSAMRKNNSAADLLVKFLNEEVSSDFILAELEMTAPSKYTYETYEATVVFQGATYPGIPVTMNDKEIETNSQGYFSESRDLTPGLNTFVIKSKEKVFTYKITRKVKVIQSVTPEGSMTVDGGMTIGITVEAYQGSKVTASLGGRTVTLTESETKDDESNRESSYVAYVGSITAPAAGTTDQKLGTIRITATYLGQTETADGASVTVNKRVAVGSGTPVRVKAEQAEVFPATTSDNTSDPNSFPLPKGALDYAIGNEIVYRSGSTTYRYYKLESGARVYSSAIESSSRAAGGNQITGMSITGYDGYTDVCLSMTQNVSYKVTASQKGISFKFNYTTSVPGNLTNLTKNPVIAHAVWQDTTLTLTFRNTGVFLGYRAFYDENSHILTLRFNNAPSSLSDARIVIDPGHGGADPGALGNIAGLSESYINYQVGARLAQVLQNEGASVLFINTRTSGKVELADRMNQAAAYQPDFFISIHCNSALNTAAAGHESYYFYPFSQNLATAVNSGVGYGISNNRGVHFSRYLVTRTSLYASTLAEIGFVSNFNEYTQLLNATVQSRIAQGIAAQLENYIQKIYPGYYAGGTESVGTENQTVSGQPQQSFELSLGEGPLELSAGSQVTLNLTVSDKNVRVNPVYTSQNPLVVQVDANGVVRAVGGGQTTVTVIDQNTGITASRVVSVSGPPAQQEQPSSNQPPQTASGQELSAAVQIQIQPQSVQLRTGQGCQLVIRVNEAGFGQALSLSSTNPNVAYIDGNAVIYAQSPGTAVIWVATQDGKTAVPCQVMVVE